MTQVNGMSMLRSVLGIAAVSAVCYSLTLVEARAQTQGLLREVYTGIGGTSVSDLTGNAAFPDHPEFEEVIATAFEAPTDVLDNYGQRMRALLTAPTTGNYVFWIASDDASALFLSTDETPANKRQIAAVASWTPSRVWGNEPGQKSAPVSLQAGRSYYVEALMKEGGGGDNLAVRWQLPNGTIEEPIPGTRLQVYGLGPPQIVRQPASVSVIEGQTATFTLDVSRASGMTYRWQRNSVDIPQATNAALVLPAVRLNDSGVRFRCVLANGQGGATSAEALLTVTADTVPPTLAAVVNYSDPQRVSVIFSEPVEVASASQPANYALSGGAAALQAVLTDDPATVVLTTTPLTLGQSYTLTVRGVRDRATAPNTIGAGSSRSFTLTYVPVDPSWVGGPLEALGPSSRRTGLVISEIMYHPAARADGRNAEFVEIFNSHDWPEDLGGARLSGDLDYTFPAGTTIAARAFLVVAAAPADLQAVYGIPNALGGFTNRLSNGAGTVRLNSRSGAVLLEARFSGAPPYPAAADGAGHSLVLARPSYGERDPRAWAASDVAGGSPGRAEAPRNNPFRTLLLNELLAHTDDPDVDYIELYNFGTQPLDLAGLVLTDDPATNRYVIPAGTVIAPLGFAVFTQTTLGFALNAGGESICLKDPASQRIVDALRFSGQANGVGFGRYPDGAPQWRALGAKTPGAPNAPLAVRPVVINEIMYAPITRDGDDEFVELHNPGSAPVEVGRWRLRGGVDFTFPSNAVMAPHGYLVVARNASHVRTNYAGLTVANCVGDYRGSLANGGERLVLERPDLVARTNAQGRLETNTIHIAVDELDFRAGGRWGKWSQGGGSSLELIDPRGDSRRAPNWADSDETAKGQWTTIEARGALDNGDGAIDELQIFLQGTGECLVDNVEVLDAAGANLCPNGTFESGLDGWVPQGNHSASGLEPAGLSSTRALHVRALGRGDPGANRIRIPLSRSLSPNTTATLRAQVKWLKGHPELMLRVHGNWLEAFGRMKIAANLGTPGAPNSVARPNAAPAVFEVAHSPVLPAANQPVVVRAQVHDPDGLAAVVLKYRLDPATNLLTVPMAYGGAGVYTATLPGQPAGGMIAFYIQATDGAPLPATSRFPDDAPARECLVYFGDTQPPGDFGSYHLWISQATRTRWERRLKLDNGDLDATFVYNQDRAVYNVGALYGGSPWISPGYDSPIGGLCGYVFHFPEDDRMLGATDYALDWPIRDGTQQLEQIAYWIGDQLGVANNYRRYVHLFVNGNRRGAIYEDAQQPSSDTIAEWFPDDTGGDLFKIEDWFEFNDTAQFEFNRDATLENFTTAGGAKKLARYRWNWRQRATSTPNDYAALFALVDAVNGGGAGYTARVEEVADIDQWMRAFAVEHIVGNWDSYGYGRGKNMFTYKPTRGGFQMLMWDIDFVLGAGSHGPTDSLFQWIGQDSGLNKLYAHPPFRRAYWRALADAANGPLLPSRVNPILDARYAALTRNGVGASSPAAAKDFIAQRRAYILQQLATVTAPFAITSNSGNDFSTGQNMLALTGTAPVDVAAIRVNGIAYPVTWTALNAWTLRLALAPGPNRLDVQGVDRAGAPIAPARDTIGVDYTGAPDAPEGRVVISEIMYHPAVPGASFVELLNTSASTSYDLFGWRLEGVDFVFPQGTILVPGQFLVVAADRVLFGAAYGAAIPVAGEFAGNLQNGGESLRLVKPGPTPAQDVVVARVRYDDAPPWPVLADGQGSSLQLIDVAQDNARVGNWAAAKLGGVNPPPPPTPATNQVLTLVGFTNAWRYNESGADLGAAWKETVFNDAAWPGGAALLYNETAALPVPKNTPLTLGKTTYYFRTHFAFARDPAGVTLKWTPVIDDGAIVYLNGVEVYRLGMPDGAVSAAMFSARNVTDAVAEGPFDLPADSLRAGDNVLAVEVHQSSATSSDIVFGMLLEATIPSTSGGGGTGGSGGAGGTLAGSPATPGAANSVAAQLPAFPSLWLNELMPANQGGPRDRAGELDPWLELYNAGATNIDLGGFALSDTDTNLTRWAFPAGAKIGPGQRTLVWLDGQPGQTTADEWHTSFRIAPTNGLVALSRTVGTRTVVIDYLRYPALVPDQSWGAFPEGQPIDRQRFYFSTPGLPNNPASAPLSVVINEWMAGNTSTLAEPADGSYEDWFELYNPNPVAIDLSGYTLTDALTNRAKFLIPSGIILGPHGFLLVWADDQTGRNGADPYLHANFKLSLAGEEIGLFAPDGRLVDSVRFGPQTENVSQGRSPDGAAAPFLAFTRPTPGISNGGVPSENRAPVLSPVADQVAVEGELLTFAIVATDPDGPGQILAFSLVGTVPEGAAVSPSGLFQWRPAETQGPGGYSLTVRVADNGQPSRSVEQSFLVTVREANQAPVLEAIANRSIVLGDTLVITNHASDADWPANKLVFSLDAGLPWGAKVDPLTGVFTWKPEAWQAPGTNFATIRVSDNGTPSLNVKRTFQIVVQDKPAEIRIVAITPPNNGLVSISWSTQVGRTYRVYARDALAAGSWRLMKEVTALGEIETFVDDVAGARVRFYQIQAAR